MSDLRSPEGELRAIRYYLNRFGPIHDEEDLNRVLELAKGPRTNRTKTNIRKFVESLNAKN